LAKLILGFFGGLSILTGIIIIVNAVVTGPAEMAAVAFYAGCALLLAGAPLLGFARVIVLLERIERNTAPTLAKPAPQTLEQMLVAARSEPIR